MARTDEDERWTEEDLDRLLELAVTHFDESVRCYEAGSAHAALVLIAAAFEANLLGMVVAHEDELRAGGHRRGRPSKRHLSELADVAHRAGWLPAAVMDGIDILNKARTMAAHPGAYVRGARQVPELHLGDPAGYLAVYDIFRQVYTDLFKRLTQRAGKGEEGTSGAGE